MVVTSVEWIGGTPPSCALLELDVVSASGTVLQSQSLSVPTEASDRGRYSSSIYTIVDQSAYELCGATVEVESYDLAVSIPVEGWGCETDAGPDGGSDAAVPAPDGGGEADGG